MRIAPLGQKRIISGLLALLLAVALVLSQLFAFSSNNASNRLPWAYADETDYDNSAGDDLDELQRRVVQSAEDYDASIKKLAAIETRLAETYARINELEQLISVQKEKMLVAINEYYRMQSSSNLLLELVFGSGSFGSFLANLEYAMRVQENYTNEYLRLKRMCEEQDAARESLEKDRQAAADEKVHAEEKLIDAKRLREEAYQRELERQRLAAEEAERKRIEEEQRRAEELKGIDVVYNEEGLSEIDWSMSKEEFIEHWTIRLDAWLRGYTLEGYGRVFAEAAWYYGVDPRFSPAISLIESGVGRACFQPHNAWGWGWWGWPDWETAIWAHVKGLGGTYYNGYLSIAAAQTYCPPNWEYWYYVTLNEMKKM